MTRRVATLVVSLLVAFLTVAGGILLALDTFATTESGDYRRAARHFAKLAEPVWSDLEHEYRLAFPAIGLPARDPAAAIASLERHPAVQQAFLLSADRKLTLSWPAIGDPPRKALTVDLATWRPRLLSPSGQPMRWVDPLRESPANRAAKLLEQRILDVRRWLRYAAQRSDVADTWTKVGQSDRWGYSSVYVVGDARRGWVGQEQELLTFYERALPAALARAGLAGILAYQGDGESPWAVPMPRNRFRLAASLVPEPVHRWEWWALQELWFSIAIAALAIVLTLALSLAVRAGAGLLRDLGQAHAQSNFVSGISHEMRLPLTTVKMYADMLAQGVVTEPEKREAYLRTIGQEADRLSRLIENVLDFSRISNRRRSYRMERLRVADLVTEATAASDGALQGAGLTVAVDVPPDLAVVGDRQAIVQSLVNLLSNAAKYARDGKRVAIAAGRTGGRIRVSVRDFGPGIPERERKRVFRPFYRSGDELTRTATGSGLGLALVKEYMAAHGGRVELHGRPGDGSRFDLILPANP
ncbi:MAG: HAMP domain-containing histidine kinase [Candidatus Sericytochromatia bacterium]|nr:HAMP domain-containing histidine kinase [Candidatus Tanganyikabacteria bacterium]